MVVFKMREMKDSGIEWIEDIPTHWELTKIANLYRVRNQKVSDKDFPPLSVTMKGILPQLETAAKTNNGDNRKLLIYLYLTNPIIQNIVLLI